MSSGNARADSAKKIIRALYDYQGTTDEELAFLRGEQFTVLSSENEDWWYVTSLDGKKEGYVPSTFMRDVDDTRSDDLDNEGEDLDDIREADEEQDPDNEPYPENDEENYFDDGREMQDYGDDDPDVQESQRPDDMMDVIKEQKLAQLRRKSSIRQPKGTKLMAPDPIQGISNLPKGFRASTLSKNADQGIGDIGLQLIPSVNSSGLAFRDLFLDHPKHQVRKRPVKSTVAFSIIDARNIPLPSPDMKILGRRVRMALFDKTNILSNIQNVDAVFLPEFEGTWKFSSKASLLFPKDDENTCFLRVNDVDIRLSILFEVCLIIEVPSKEEGVAPSVAELSCGWGLLPLFTADGGPIENKTYEIKLYGGTPFEKNVDLDMKPEKKGFLGALIQTSRAPRLNIRVWKLGKAAMSSMDTLPDVFVGFLAAVPILTMYRRIAANALMAYQKDSQTLCITPTSEPALTIVPKILQSNDLTRLLISVWDKKRRLMKRRDLQSYSKMKAAFTTIIYSIWPLVDLHGMPDYIPGDNVAFHFRQSLIRSLQENGPIQFMTGMQGQGHFKPFGTTEVHFDFFKMPRV